MQRRYNCRLQNKILYQMFQDDNFRLSTYFNNYLLHD